MKTNFGVSAKPFMSAELRDFAVPACLPVWSVYVCGRETMPLFDTSVNSTEPVTMSGPWYSSPSFFQYSVSEKIFS